MSTTPALDLALAALDEGRDLTAREAEAAFSEIMEGKADDTQKSALLMGLRAKGETSSEVSGGVRALRRAVIGVRSADPDGLVDTAGTGGGKGLVTFNISTAAAFVLAGAGVPVAKHGNRSHTSRCGSADVLEALDVNIDLTPEQMSRVLDEVGFTFMFAPALHPAMKHVAPVRRALGVSTIMNILGPLTNPAGARRQLVGVAEPDMLRLVAGALAELGHIRALVVHGEPGIDELSPLGTTRMILVENGAPKESSFDPRAELGWSDIDPDDLRGGEPKENAETIMSVLEGKGKPGAVAAVLLNAAAGLHVAGRTESIPDGVNLARAALDSGQALETLLALRKATKT